MNIGDYIFYSYFVVSILCIIFFIVNGVKLKIADNKLQKRRAKSQAETLKRISKDEYYKSVL